MSVIILNPVDDVAVLTSTAEAGTRPLETGDPLTARLPQGHKIARHAIAKGAEIRKFGQVIGHASENIPQGAHVHTHNCAMGCHDQNYVFGADLEAARKVIPAVAPRHFNGYLRTDGRVGTRNMIALVATVNCSAGSVALIFMG